MPTPHFPPAKVRMLSSAAGGLLLAGTASTSLRTIFHPHPLSWSLCKKTQKTSNKSTTNGRTAPTILSLPVGGRSSKRNKGKTWCLSLVGKYVVYRKYRSLGTTPRLTFQARLLHNQEGPMSTRVVFGRSRQELSLDVSVSVYILLVVEQSSLESQ